MLLSIAFGDFVPGEASGRVKIGGRYIVLAKNGVGGGETLGGFAGEGVERANRMPESVSPVAFGKIGGQEGRSNEIQDGPFGLLGHTVQLWGVWGP